MGMTESSVKELNCASGRPKKRIDALLHDAASLDSSDDGRVSYAYKHPYHCP
jgi:hypothetical protein